MQQVVKQEMDLMRLVERFDSDEKCRAYLEHLRWPEGVKCPRCESPKVSSIHDRGQFDCDSCRYQFSVMVGTIFHDSHLPLRKWLIATYLMCESKKGMSALQLKRTLNIAYQTAWYLCHRIRAAMVDADAPRLTGTVEADETYVGGKVRGQGHGYRGNKAMVVGVVQRKGEVRLRIAPSNDRVTLHGFIKANTAPETKNIYTDEWPAYKGVGDADTKHDTVNHSIEEWVRGDVHTNTVESVWSLLKRSIVGSYHHVSVKHLDAYLDELEWRFNNRENPYLFRDTLLKLLGASNLEYKTLIAQ